MTRVRQPVGRPPRLNGKSRFRFQREGRDVGPFTLEGLQDEVEALRCPTDTLVFEERTQTWFRAGDHPGLAAIAKAAQDEAHRQQLMADTDRAAATVQTSHTRRWWLANAGIAAILGAGGTAAWLLFGSTPVAPTHQPYGILAPMSLERIAPWTPPSEDQIFQLALAEPSAPEPQKATAKRVRKPGSGGANAVERIDTNDGGAAVAGSMEVNYDFVDEVVAGGGSARSLDEGEVRRLSARIGKRVTPCLEAEAERTPSFRGVTVEFTLEPSGSAAGIRLTDGGQVTTEFVRCVRQRVQGARVEPFAGAARLVRVPLRITN